MTNGKEASCLRQLEKLIDANLSGLDDTRRIVLTDVYLESLGNGCSLLVTRGRCGSISVEHRLRLYGKLLVPKEQGRRLKELANAVSNYLRDVAAIKQAEQPAEQE